MFKKTKVLACLRHLKLIKMKYIYITFLPIAFLFGCTNINTSNTANTPKANTAETENIDDSRAGKLATKTCECLKPFTVLQKQYGNQEIDPSEYASRLQKLAKPMQECTNKLTEATEDDPDFKDEVLFKMKQICPAVAEIIVPAQ